MLIKIRTFSKKQFEDIKTYGIRELFRKFYLLIKVFSKIPIVIIAIIPCIIIRLVRPWIIIRTDEVPAGNYGDFVFCTAMYYCKKKLKIDLPTKKYIDLLYLPYKDKLFNKQLAKMWKRKLNFLPSYLLDPISKANKFIPGWKKHTVDFIYVGNGTPYRIACDVDNLLEKCQPLDFTVEEEIYGKKMLDKFGLKDDDKFVCFAIRDSAYQLSKSPARFRDWSYHDYRDYDVEKFILAAEELAKRGYYIFRMGVVVNKPFNSSNPKIIDYANSNLRSDFMDVYLGAKCSFCLTTGFGFQDIPSIFRRPLALIQCPFGDIIANGAYSKKSLVMTKHHILKKENRKLSLSEIFSHGVAYAYRTEIFKQKGIELADITPNEIKDLVLEMVENLEFKEKSKPQDEELQKTFKNLFTSNIKRTVHPWITDHEVVEKICHRFFDHGPYFSTKFLRENRNWLR